MWGKKPQKLHYFIPSSFLMGSQRAVQVKVSHHGKSYEREVNIPRGYRSSQVRVAQQESQTRLVLTASQLVLAVGTVLRDVAVGVLVDTLLVAALHPSARAGGSRVCKEATKARVREELGHKGKETVMQKKTVTLEIHIDKKTK